ncbi:hypothetical protein DFH08DRAFT_206055 [Mycena albidolilacea]|uniref:Uncharacterized protein n=1 Tax=Mycena albidolilacea TaxID=1033008 RepID=A0AAD7ESC1_9AGAR|nr:hypothetical protein DFH08DRAFT_206055 [Mycena albidolilacea]
MYNASPMITAVESLAAPPQSGHAYLRANMQMKSKVKTRPVTAVAEMEEVRVESPILPSGVPLQRTMTGGTLKKASLLGRFRNGGDEDSKKKWYSMFLKLSKQPAQGLRLLVKGRELSWKDFLKIMADLGFTVTEPDGNSVKFVPPFEKAPTVTLHRPHDRVCRVKHLKKIRKVLMDSYGWVPEEILAVLE